MPGYDEQLQLLITSALVEDMGDGDHSTLSCIPSAARGHARLKIKDEGILAGVEVAKKIFLMIDPSTEFSKMKKEH